MSAEGDLVINALVVPVGVTGLAVGTAALKGGALLAATACDAAAIAGHGLWQATDTAGRLGAWAVRTGAEWVRSMQDAWQAEMARQEMAHEARFADRDALRTQAIRTMAHLAQIERARQVAGAAGVAADAELAAWAAAGRHCLGLLEQNTTAALPAVSEWLEQMEQVRREGLRTLEGIQQTHVGDLLVEALEASGYTVVRDEPFGTDRRLSAMRPEPRRRVVWRLSPGGRLAFDVTDGYAGQDCHDLLADVLDHMRRRGVRFTLGPELDAVDRILRRVGTAFEASGGRFRTEHLGEHPNHEDPGRQRT